VREIRSRAPRTVAAILALPDDDPDVALIGQAVSLYDGEAFVGRPFGQVGSHGALTRRETLTLTEEILAAAYGPDRPPYLSPGAPAWTGDYAQGFRDRLPERAGYVYHAGDGAFAAGYFVLSERRRYDFQEPGLVGRGLTTAERPPLGLAAERDTRISYD